MLLNNETIINRFYGISDFNDPDKSFSPLYSNIGLTVDPETGYPGRLYFHYNRYTRVIMSRFLGIKAHFNREKSSVTELCFGKKEEICIKFFDKDCFAVRINADKDREYRFCDLFEFDKENCFEISVTENDGLVTVSGYSKNGDARDPDKYVPFKFGISLLKGQCKYDSKGELTFAFQDKALIIVLVFEALCPSLSSIEEKSFSIESFEDCDRISNAWLKESLKKLKLSADEGKESELAVRAIHSLVSNTAKAPGNLDGYLSSFPSRGGYPTHFLWDTCFQNLAYELINPKLAKEFILQLFAQQRPDGKIPQFNCSTWVRPHDSQPALVGWATKRLVDKKAVNTAFIKAAADCLEKNNNWWLNSRTAACGLVMCDDGLETGQDNHPRFDGRVTLACDMNAYLLSQMRVTGYLFDILGNDEKAALWQEKADKTEELMLEYLYNEKENIFFDLDLKTGKPVRIVSPNCILPLWAGVNPGEGKSKKMIEDYLLNPGYMFGDVPFPSVAYNQKEYECDNWWRGPMWCPIAYLMLETLEKYGYTEEYNKAKDKILNIIEKDGKPSELFDSRTGEGLGCNEQGWTGAIFLKLLSLKQQG